MTKNALALFKDAPPADPFFDEEMRNIPERQTVPSLSYKGKVWSVSINGETRAVTKKDEEGDDVPVPMLPVFVIDAAKRRGRAFYDGEYDGNNTKGPVCWSEDGVTPDASVPAEQELTKGKFVKPSKCDTCPAAAKGSKVTDSGRSMTACSQHRMLVVAPLGRDGSLTPLRMKIAVTSDWDGDNKENEAVGWYAFSQYLDRIRAGGVNHTAKVVTKMKFDNSKEYPKVLFSPSRWASADELDLIKDLIKSGEVEKLLKGFTPDGVDGKPRVEGPKDEPEVAAKKVEPPPIGADDDDVPPPITKAKPVEEPKKAKAKPAPVDDEDDVPPPKAKAAKPKEQDVAAKPTTASTSVPEDVQKLLADWDD